MKQEELFEVNTEPRVRCVILIWRIVVEDKSGEENELIFIFSRVNKFFRTTIKSLRNGVKITGIGITSDEAYRNIIYSAYRRLIQERRNSKPRRPRQ